MSDEMKLNRDWRAEAEHQSERADRAEARLRVVQAELEQVARVVVAAGIRVQMRVPVTCDECGETVPRGWPCSCDGGRE